MAELAAVPEPVTGVACEGHEPSGLRPPRSLLFVVPSRESAGDVPASDATGSFAAAPPADWPCAIRERYEGDAEWKVKLRLVYGKRASCRLPVALVEDGIVGCGSRGRCHR
jgi:hypothetical protein